MAKSLRVYDYVNHPFESVNAAFGDDPKEVFANATKVAASRARSVASELHVNIAGIEFAKDIDITVTGIEHHEKKVMVPAKTVIGIEWAASENPHLFPLMKAELSIYPLTATETQLDLEGEYSPPLGIIGGAIDAAVGHRIADAAVHQFISDVAMYLRTSLDSK